MGQVWELVGQACKSGGMPDAVIDHFDRIGTQLGFEHIEVRYDAENWIVIYHVGRFQVPLNVPRNVPPELLTDELADDLVKEIRESMREDEERKKALADFNAQPLIGQIPAIKH